MQNLEALKKHVKETSGWDRFMQLGLPTKKWETFRYVRLNDLYSQSFEMANSCHLPFTPKEGQLVFVNGCYIPALSKPPKELIALPLKEAMKTYRNFLKPRLEYQLKREKDPFAALNVALSQEGLFIYLPPRSKSRFEVIHLIEERSDPIMTYPQIYLFAGKEAMCECFFFHQAEDFVNSLIDCALDESAFLKLTSILNENSSSWHFDALRVTLKRNSHFKSYAMTNGGATSRQDYVIQLLEEGGEASLFGICQVGDRRHHHTNVLMEHHAPFCRSSQTFKNVLNGISRTSFEGKIYIHPAAQKTEAYQMNANLILSKHAFANSKPNLEIFADDVKASHGSTVGQLDEEQLFYCKTRGISTEEAKRLLVEGFCKEILDQIERPYANMCRFS